LEYLHTRSSKKRRASAIKRGRSPDLDPYMVRGELHKKFHEFGDPSGDLLTAHQDQVRSDIRSRRDD